MNQHKNTTSYSQVVDDLKEANKQIKEEQKS